MQARARLARCRYHVEPQVAWIVAGHGALEERVERGAVWGDRHPLEAAARGQRGPLDGAATRYPEERVLRRPHAGNLHRRRQHAPVLRDVNQKRPEFLAHPQRAVGGAHERFRIEIEAGQDAGGGVAAARGRRGRKHVEGKARQPRTGLLIAHDGPRNSLIGVAESRGREDERTSGIVPARINPMEHQLEIR